ncbi:MAG: TetR/AcrR family transcriptional regulator [Clostridiales bacterium]|nr:TetR/AcrR family transcriptional regulator [Clostridiales bacterium]
MPPKVKISKEDILQTAIELVRKGGEEAVNARAIAGALNCSTQPIFSNFASMEELQGGVLAYAHGVYLSFLKAESEKQEYPKYKAFGMAYIRFAKQEKELFKMLFMRDRSGEPLIETQDFSESVQMIMQANCVSKQTAERMHLEIWTCVHGIATMLATSFLNLEWELISNILTDVYQGLRAKHLKEN